MGEFHFGVGNGRIKTKSGERIDKIARRHGASFTWTTIPGQGPIYWFAARNQGHPFDEQTARAVWADLDAAKLAADGKLSTAVFRKE
jgi:hypothetical protein